MTEDVPVPNVSPDVLNARELRVAKLAVAGLAVNEIAKALECSCAAVFANCDTICGKLGVDDYTTMLRWAKHYDIARW